MPVGPRYQILMADKAGTPPFPGFGPFTDPAEAAAIATAMSKETGEKLMIKPIINPEWRKRERKREENGQYRPLPWYGDRWWCSDAAHAIWKDHYPHPSIERPGYLAYTKSEEDGSIDKQTIVKPGAYLKKYFEQIMDRYGMSERKLVELFMQAYGPTEVKFAVTEDEIISVYENGPETCMVAKEWPHDGRNPAYIYAAGDLQVAYLGALERATARVLVWPAKKIYSRVYGDIARLTMGLERMGYKWGAPIGAKVKKVQVQEVKFDPRMGYPTHCFVAPYIDKKNQRGGGHLSIIDNGDHMLICEEGKPGSHHCGLADGLSGQYVPRPNEYPTFTCEHCGTPGFKQLVTLFDTPEDGDELYWCPKCIKKDAFHCYWSNTHYPKDSVESVLVDGHPWCQYYADMYASKCEMSGKLCNNETLLTICIDGKLKKVSLAWLDENGGYFTSNLTRRNFLRKERVYVNSDNFGPRYGAKPELPHHAFTCDSCNEYWVIDERNQHDDKLLCRHCYGAPKLPLGEEPKKPSLKKYSLYQEEIS